MDNVIDFTGITKLDLPAEKILSTALTKNLNTVVILGYDEKGNFYFASCKSDGGEVLWLLELAKCKLMKKSIEL